MNRKYHFVAEACWLIVFASLTMVLAAIGSVVIAQSGDRGQWPEWREVRERRLWPHKDAVSALTFSRDGKGLVSGSYDKTVQVMHLPNADLDHRFSFRQRISGYAFPVVFAQLLPDGETIVSSGREKGAQLWRIDNAQPIGSRITDINSAMALSPDGKILAVGKSPESTQDEATILLLQVSDGKLLKTLKGHKQLIFGLQFSPDGKWLVGGGAPTTFVWSVTEGELLHSLAGHSGRVRALAFSPDGKYLASGGLDSGGVCIWQLPESLLVHKLNWNPVMDLAFSHDSKLLAVCSTSDNVPAHSLHLISTFDGKQLQTLWDDFPEVKSIAFHPKHNILAAGRTDGSIRFYVPEQ